MKQNARNWGTSLTQSLIFFAATLLSWQSAQAALPDCLDGKQVLPVDNDQVLFWKDNTANQFLARAHVSGYVALLPGKTKPVVKDGDHIRVAVQIGSQTDNLIEVIYNVAFGRIPEKNVQVGMPAEICGDYITANKQAGPYKPSPVGAIIHWVHINPKGKGHDSGYVSINSALYGQDATHAAPAFFSFDSESWQ